MYGSSPLPLPVPGRLFRLVKLVSWIELGLFAALLFFWLAPGYQGQTSTFGLAHGLGFLLLCGVVWAACLRREAPWPLFAATLTPAGPVGSVIGIALIERRGWGVATPSAAGATRPGEEPRNARPAGGVDTRPPNHG